MTAIHDDLHAVEARVTEALLDELDITAARIVDAVSLADLLSGHAVRLHIVKDFLFDERLQVVRELEAIRSEDLQPIVLIRIVRRRQHDAGAASHGLSEMGDRRRRHGADQENIHAARDQSAGQRGLQHVAGDTRILADDDPVMIGPAGTEDAGNRLADA